MERMDKAHEGIFTAETVRELIDRAYKALPPRPVLKFSVERGTPGLFDCKLGGIPYFPKDMEYPKGIEGEYKGTPLRLLAQINFEQIPHIPDFPETGIIQFFCACDDNEVYGMPVMFGANDRCIQNGFRVIYHENIITDEEKLMTADEMPDFSKYDEIALRGFSFPFYGEYVLKAETPCEATPYICDHRFQEAFVKFYNEISEEPVNEWYKVHNDVWECDKEIWGEINSREDNNVPQAFIGGYPYFVQDDPRYYSDYKDCDTVLFELTSTYNIKSDIDIMWGDCGTGTFLIPREALKNKDFSRVVYNYDCC